MLNENFLQYHERGLLSDREWARLTNEAFYEAAYRAGEMTVVEGKESTKRRARCDVCLKHQAPGMKKFWYRHDWSSWWCFFCEGCLRKLQIISLSNVKQ